MAASGDHADFQFICEATDEMVQEDKLAQDGCRFGPRQLWNCLSNFLYHRRSKMEPLLVSLVVAGWSPVEQEPFLGVANSVGNRWEEEFASTGFGGRLGTPLLRGYCEATPRSQRTRAAALEILEKSMAIAHLRDCKAGGVIQVTQIDANGVVIGKPYALPVNWDLELMNSKSTEYQ